MEFEGFSRVKISDLVPPIPVKVETKTEEVKVDKTDNTNKKAVPNGKIRIIKTEIQKPEAQKPEPVVLPNQYTKKVRVTSPKQEVSVIPKEVVQFPTTISAPQSAIKKEVVKIPEVQPPIAELPKEPVIQQPKEFRKYIDLSFSQYRNPYVTRIYTK